MNLTASDYLKNCEIFLSYWSTIPTENIAPNLRTWNTEPKAPHSCKTIACSGGWLPAMPEFAATGVVTVISDFYPYGVSGHQEIPGLRYGADVAEYLFGDSELFQPRSVTLGDSEDPQVSDHECVTRRFTLHTWYLRTLQPGFPGKKGNILTHLLYNREARLLGKT